MATDKEHQRQAAHNQELLDVLDRQRFPDWATTIAFYKAVHLVQAFFHVTGDSCGSHTARNGILKSKYPEIWRHYHPLYSFSRLARYWCLKVKPDHVEYVIRRLNKLEREIERELKDIAHKKAS
jgi:hypothetical protein